MAERGRAYHTTTASPCSLSRLGFVIADDRHLILCTGNAKHFNPIRDLKIRVFKP